jgi:Ca2+-transporting ATPase
LAKSAALCSSAQVAFSEEKQLWQVSGDPTEAALVVFGQKLGYRKEALEEDMPQIEEMPFSSATKYHAVVHKNNSGQEILTVIGAPEAVLDSSSSLWQEKKNIHLAKAEKEQLEQTVTDISKQGLRVLGVATKLINQRRADGVVEVDNLTFIGFVGMKDALREEVKDALTKTREAGMKVVMITGDHKLTAQAIAEEAGIFTEGNKVLTGVEIESLTDAGLAQAVENVSVYARVTPDHKLRIIQAYKSRGEIIAMTGDGVNDAPSLVAADLGVAMGRGGTEVAKEAADIVLLDDNFGNIAAAVEEGRSIYKTIRKVILYLFSTGLGETLAIAFAIFLDLPLPVLASQIIWLNFVTDGFLDVSLAMEPKEPGLLREPRSTTTSFLDFSMVRRMFLMALPMAIGSLWLFSRYLDGDMTKALTMSMTVLAVFQWFNAWNCRSEKKSVFRIGFSSNKYLLAATFIVVALQLLAVYHPFLQRFLHTTALTLGEWVIILIVASSVILVEELRKLWVRSKDL